MQGQKRISIFCRYSIFSVYYFQFLTKYGNILLDGHICNDDKGHCTGRIVLF